MHSTGDRVSQVVMQPTTLCNIDCAYCYLPDRHRRVSMAPAVASAVAASIPSGSHPLPISWHAGEPLATGLDAFIALVEPFGEHQRRGAVTHVVQTNATLIDDKWIDFFEENSFVVGVSIDGDADANRLRTTRSRRSSYFRAMRGIERLRARGYPFHAIAVVSGSSFGRADALYNFFCELGCVSLGLNIEEQIGARGAVNHSSSIVRKFWFDMLAAWEKDRRLEIREIHHLLAWMRAVADQNPPLVNQLDLLPSVGANGDVVLLSPEFVGIPPAPNASFVVGNVLQEGLNELLLRASSVSYVVEFAKGVARCEAECSFFSACGGRSAANKYFETGSTNATVTMYCMNSTQLPALAILDAFAASRRSE